MLIGYFNEDGILVYHPFSTASNYIKGGFITDLFGCLPLENLESTRMDYHGMRYCYHTLRAYRWLSWCSGWVTGCGAECRMFIPIQYKNMCSLQVPSLSVKIFVNATNDYRWMREARNRSLRRHLGQAYVQQWSWWDDALTTQQERDRTRDT